MLLRGDMGFGGLTRIQFILVPSETRRAGSLSKSQRLRVD
jgi:hypothetical protein